MEPDQQNAVLLWAESELREQLGLKHTVTAAKLCSPPCPGEAAPPNQRWPGLPLRHHPHRRQRRLLIWTHCQHVCVRRGSGILPPCQLVFSCFGVSRVDFRLISSLLCRVMEGVSSLGLEWNRCGSGFLVTMALWCFRLFSPVFVVNMATGVCQSSSHEDEDV